MKLRELALGWKCGLELEWEGEEEEEGAWA